ncbi:hypothetical protein AAKU67_000580 [Oxalobacteraceae bacterium GrIS 2.11]
MQAIPTYGSSTFVREASASLITEGGQGQSKDVQPPADMGSKICQCLSSVGSYVLNNKIATGVSAALGGLGGALIAEAIEVPEPVPGFRTALGVGLCLAAPALLLFNDLCCSTKKSAQPKASPEPPVAKDSVSNYVPPSRSDVELGGASLSGQVHIDVKPAVPDGTAGD